MQRHFRFLSILLIVTLKSTFCFSKIYEIESVKIVKLDSSKSLIRELPNNQLSYIDSLINSQPINKGLVESCNTTRFFIQLTNDTIQILRGADTKIDTELYKRLNKIKPYFDNYISDKTGLIICLIYTPKKITFNNVDEGLWKFESKNHKSENLLNVLPFLDSSIQGDTVISYLINKRRYTLEYSNGISYVRRRKEILFKFQGIPRYFDFIGEDSCLFVFYRKLDKLEKMVNELFFITQESKKISYAFSLKTYDLKIQDLGVDKLLFNQIASTDYQLRISPRLIDYPKYNSRGIVSSGGDNYSIPTFWGNAFIEIPSGSKYLLLQTYKKIPDWRLMAVFNEMTNTFYCGWTKE